MDIIPRKRRASEGSDTSSDSEAIAAVEAALHSQDQQQQPEMPRISSVEMLDLPPGCIPMAPEDDKNASSTTWYPCSMEGCLRRYKHKKNLAFHIKNDHCDPSDMKVVTCPHEGCGKIFKYTSVMKRHCLLFHSGPEVREGQLRKRRKGKTPRGESAAGESQRWRVLVGSSEVEVDDGEEVQQAAMKEPSDGEGWPLSTTGDDAVTVVGASSASATEVATAGGGEGDYRAVMGIMGTTGATSKLYQCLFPGCEKVFTSKGSWGMHRDSIHVKPHSFVCPVETCGRKFSYKHVMQTHCERVHGMETGRAGGKARSAKQRQQQQQPSTESLTAAAAAAAEEEEKEEGAEDTNRDPATSSSSSSSLSGRRRLPTEAAITTASGGASTSASSTSTSVGRGTDTGAWGGGILGVAGVAREREDGEADPADVAAFTLAGGEEEGGIQKSVPQLYPCDFPGCTKVFSWKGSLALHYDRIHKLHKAFVCPMQGCDKAFSYKHVLKSHLRRIHKLDPAPAPAAGSISEAAADGASSPNSNSNSDTAAAVPADAATTTTTTTTTSPSSAFMISALASSSGVQADPAAVEVGDEG